MAKKSLYEIYKETPEGEIQELKRRIKELEKKQEMLQRVLNLCRKVVNNVIEFTDDEGNRPFNVLDYYLFEDLIKAIDGVVEEEDAGKAAGDQVGD